MFFFLYILYVILLLLLFSRNNLRIRVSTTSTNKKNSHLLHHLLKNWCKKWTLRLSLFFFFIHFLFLFLVSVSFLFCTSILGPVYFSTHFNSFMANCTHLFYIYWDSGEEQEIFITTEIASLCGVNFVLFFLWCQIWIVLLKPGKLLVFLWKKNLCL